MLVEIKGTFVKALRISARLSLQFQALSCCMYDQMLKHFEMVFLYYIYGLVYN